MLQGILLNEENAEEIIEYLRIKLKHFIDKLCKFSQPHMKEWNIRHRKLRQMNENLNNSSKETFSNFTTFQSKKQILVKSSTNLSDQGFIQPDWALIFMLRLGLMSVLMLPENTQANIIIVTDGVCGVPDSQALQNILAQLRSFTVSCSFIQVKLLFF